MVHAQARLPREGSPQNNPDRDKSLRREVFHAAPASRLAPSGRHKECAFRGKNRLANLTLGLIGIEFDRLQIANAPAPKVFN
jgi:hypothetical protein